MKLEVCDLMLGNEIYESLLYLSNEVMIVHCIFYIDC